MIYLQEIVEYLDTKLQKSLYNEDMPSLWKDTQNPVSKVGLALEPFTGIEVWIEENKLDTLFLHRPWKITEHNIPLGTSLFAYHLSFDEHLTVGYNLHLCKELDLSHPEIFGTREGRPIGMICETKHTKPVDICKQVDMLFHGVDELFQMHDTDVNRVAFVGAMRPDLIYNASEAAVQLYVTGQIRKQALKTAIETGMSVIAVGHDRSEYYGLNLLSQLLLAKWPDLQIVLVKK